MSPSVMTLTPGELVEITIRRAVVAAVGVADDGSAEEVSVSYGTGRVLLPLHDPNVVVERLAPAEWPPQLGDLWRDSEGELWFVTQTAARYAELGRLESSARLRLVRSVERPNDACRTPEQLLQHSGPVELVHREPAPVDEGGDV